MLEIRYAEKPGMLKILMGPNVKILMGQSFGSWTHGHRPIAWAQSLAHVPGPGPMARRGSVGTRVGGGARHGRRPGPMGQALGPGHGPMPMCPGAKALAHEYFDIWAHKYF